MHKLLTLLSLFTLILTINLQADRGLKLTQMKVEQRVALVIGNNNYTHKKLTNLKNPVNDARAMKAKLKKLGFNVVYGENLTVRDMDKKLDIFSRKLSNGGVGLFFFAGHGIEYKHENYLMAKNSNINDKNDVKYESLPLNKILDSMEDAGNRLNIVLLDACRNDPFSRGGSGGLAKSTAKGTFIVYATSPGDVASDGSGKHGAFTQEVLNNIDAPGIPIERVFKNVKIGVINSTSKAQRPWVSNDITGDFYFVLPTSKKIPTKSKTISNNESSFRFGDNAPLTHSLTINQTPSDARVSITNIELDYYDGIALEAGTYNIEVSKPGYYPKTGKVDLQSDLEIEIGLKKKKESLYIKKKNIASQYYNNSSAGDHLIDPSNGRRLDNNQIWGNYISTSSYTYHSDIGWKSSDIENCTGRTLLGVWQGNDCVFSSNLSHKYGYRVLEHIYSNGWH